MAEKKTTDKQQMTPEQARGKLAEAIEESNEVLAEITTAFQLFPVTLTLDRAKLSATKKEFLKNTPMVSLMISDLKNVSAEVGMLIGSVKVVKKVLSSEDPFTLGPFMRKDALAFATTAQGLVIALERKIDLAGLPTEELKALLTELGKDKNVDYPGS